MMKQVKKKKKAISANEVIAQKFRDNPMASRDELVDIVKIYGERPDPKVLIERDYNNRVNRIIRKIRNEDGQRVVYADKAIKSYVDVENSRDVESLKRINSGLHRQSTGNGKAAIHIGRRIQELGGQMTFEFEDSKGGMTV